MQAKRQKWKEERMSNNLFKNLFMIDFDVFKAWLWLKRLDHAIRSLGV